MNRHTSLGSLLRSVWRREWAIVGALGLSWTVALSMLAWRVADVLAVAVVVLVSGTVTLLLARSRTRKLDPAWLTRTLDAACPGLQDSSALLASDAVSTDGLRWLQAERVRSSFARVEQPELRRSWPWPLLALSYALAAASLLIPQLDGVATGDAAASTAARTAERTHRHAAPPRVTRVQLAIRPPAYTGLPTRNIDTIAARAPVGSILRWSVRVTRGVESLALVTHDGQVLPFSIGKGGAWQGGATLTRSLLVRAETKGTALDTRLHRVVAIPDRAPRVRRLTPSRTLSLVTPGQKTFALRFQAEDDYGIAGAKLVVTLAQGSGENIGVRTQTLAIAGSGPARDRRFAASLDLAALGMQRGDDLVVQLHVDDNRRPRSQTTRSASSILRWPLPPSKDQSSMDGLVQRVLPAYFRSQRQIIIDSEALLKQRPVLARDEFVSRSDAIGVDQRVLRLRYGQFLGEEGAEPPHLRAGESVEAARGDSASSTEARAASIFADEHVHDAETAREAAESKQSVASAAEIHPHEEASPGAAPVFGASVSVTDEFGHTHDIPEAATLLDPATQKLLRAALGEMWQAELHLRQGSPQDALPFERRALDLIKQVQQADRIYLARVGSEIPQVDEARRLTGKRDGLRNRSDHLAAARASDDALSRLWLGLGEASVDARNAVPETLLTQAQALLTNRTQSTQVLDAIAAIDAVRVDPECEPCRLRLRAQLWMLLPRPAAGVRRRDGADPGQQAYLDALARERQR